MVVVVDSDVPSLGYDGGGHREPRGTVILPLLAYYTRENDNKKAYYQQKYDNVNDP